MQISVTLELPRDALSIPVMRGVLTSSLKTLRVERDCIDDIAVAITEACTNVLDHSVEGDEYEVTARVIDRDCQIDVIDTGHGFDGNSLGRTGADETAESGRGIQLMRALVDSVRFESRPEAGTIVRLIKRLALSDDSPLHALTDGGSQAKSSNEAAAEAEAELVLREREEALHAGGD